MNIIKNYIFAENEIKIHKHDIDISTIPLFPSPSPSPSPSLSSSSLIYSLQENTYLTYMEVKWLYLHYHQITSNEEEKDKKKKQIFFELFKVKEKDEKDEEEEKEKVKKMYHEMDEEMKNEILINGNVNEYVKLISWMKSGGKGSHKGKYKKMKKGKGKVKYEKIVEKLMKVFTNKPIIKECYVTMKKRRSYVNFFGIFNRKWEKMFVYIKGGMLNVYGNKDSSIPNYVIQLFGSTLYEVREETGMGKEEVEREKRYKLVYEQNKRSFEFKTNDEELISSILFPIVEEQGNLYNCFTHERFNCNANWFVNGKHFYSRLAELFENAKKEIFFSSWWVSPQVYLRRKDPIKLSDRFDMILKKKAEEGVMIYFLVWNSNPFIGRLDCEYVAEYFTGLHPNFKVLLHPFAKGDYGHHQKMIVVDQEVGLQGGLDVCFGRYDDYYHRLDDPVHCRTTWPGIDYWNPTVKSTHTVRMPFVDFIDRTKHPRMGWHDVSMEVDGEGARDLSKNFVERWNNSRVHLLNFYSNLGKKLAIQKNIPHLVLNDNFPAVYFNPKWKTNIMKKLDPPILEKDYSFVNIDHRDVDITGNKRIPNVHTCRVQITRTLAYWSGNSRMTVDLSLYESWLDMINKAQHYIFIEQQYFVTNTAGLGVKNQIGECIVNRVKWAVKNNKKFRVYIIFPLQADGNYYNDDIIQMIMFYNQHSSYLSENSIVERIKRECPNVNVDDYVSVLCLRNWGKIGDKCVTEQIYPHTKMLLVDDIYCVIGSANVIDRSFLEWGDSEISSTVIDNAKVKIKMDGKDYLASKFAFTLRNYIFNEYLTLPKDSISLMDPICDETYNKILNTARKNTRIITDVFPNSPCDNITSWKNAPKCKEEEFIINPKYTQEQAEEELKKIQGIIFDFPRKFMVTGLYNLFSEKVIFLKRRSKYFFSFLFMSILVFQ